MPRYTLHVLTHLILNLMKWLVLVPFYGWGNWVTKNLNNLLSHIIPHLDYNSLLISLLLSIIARELENMVSTSCHALAPTFQWFFLTLQYGLQALSDVALAYMNMIYSYLAHKAPAILACLQAFIFCCSLILESCFSVSLHGLLLYIIALLLSKTFLLSLSLSSHLGYSSYACTLP